MVAVDPEVGVGRIAADVVIGDRGRRAAVHADGALEDDDRPRYPVVDEAGDRVVEAVAELEVVLAEPVD
jgi:hypothetical protein